jgi:hypothetical protein
MLHAADEVCAMRRFFTAALVVCSLSVSTFGDREMKCNRHHM